MGGASYLIGYSGTGACDQIGYGVTMGGACDRIGYSGTVGGACGLTGYAHFCSGGSFLVLKAGSARTPCSSQELYC